jgi:Pyridoxamine 5'-phosphate oxidase
MSIAVSLDDLRAQIDEIATDAYLLTVRDDGRPHSVAVWVRWVGDELVVPAGTTTAANAAARPSVALLWPPSARGGFSLIVDATVTGTAVVEGGHEVTLRPTKAVLHRPAGQSNDCAPVFRSAGEGV